MKCTMKYCGTSTKGSLWNRMYWVLALSMNAPSRSFSLQDFTSESEIGSTEYPSFSSQRVHGKKQLTWVKCYQKVVIYFLWFWLLITVGLFSRKPIIWFDSYTTWLSPVYFVEQKLYTMWTSPRDYEINGNQDLCIMINPVIIHNSIHFAHRLWQRKLAQSKTI